MLPNSPKFQDDFVKAYVAPTLLIEGVSRCPTPTQHRHLWLHWIM